ncbi:hypothetical protein GWO43_13715 [candidate division KSB1 bacterium]|nr:hypothetical protein [candidate division KSB1 bacterium]NIR71997.1 hypothetical protein [candidate division KSB1 bacterium]NIS24990.1 hypothetical protein [candidate division KSB1 bacterium]NIT71906.1 hypothetical protein [candidate division KSB1 bacterium]NIU25645.1 hypothetical protein [candidate division KSB1 bacterium]
MKKSHVSAVIAMFLLWGYASDSYSQGMTAERWQEDLQYLRHLITTERSNLFHTVTREEWERQADSLYAEIPNLQRHEIIVGMARLVSAFRIGHTHLPIQPWRRNAHPDLNFHRFPLLTYVFSDGVFVRSAKEKYRDAVGGRILKIGNLSIEEAMEAVRPVIPWENEQYFLSAVPYYLSCPEVLHAQGVIDDLTTTNLTIEKDEKKREILLEAESSGPFPGDYGMVHSEAGWVDARYFSDNPEPLYLKNLDRHHYYEYLPDHKLVYVRHSQVRNENDETIEQFFGRVMDFVNQNDVEKFVLDVRLNRGGNNYLNKPVIVGLIGMHKINQPGQLFTIIGRQTFSATQNLVNELEKYTETIFIGEPTSENVNFWGDTRQYELPNSGLPVRLSWLWWQNLDPRDDRPWTAPEIALDLSFEDYRNNRDPVMAEILNFENLQPLTERLRDLFLSGESAEAQQKARAYIADSRHRYDSVEDDLNGLGYDLLDEHRLDAAIDVFRLNTELYPHSANTYDSLAEGLWKKGLLEAAIENYERALQMDPGGVGVNSARMLRKIRQQMKESKKANAY